MTAKPQPTSSAVTKSAPTRSAATHHLLRTTRLDGELTSVFAFFKNPQNLEALTPPWLGFRILWSSDEEVREGTRLRYRLRLFGVPIAWESRITEYVDGSHFADEQVSGPYALWLHRHSFRALDHGVEMTDSVDYRLPFGALGRVVHWLLVRHQLDAIFNYRTRVLADVLARTHTPVVTAPTAR